MASKKRPHSEEIAKETPLGKKTRSFKKTERNSLTRSPNTINEENIKEDAFPSKNKEEIKRDKQGKLVFPDHPEFKPNLSPKEVLQAGSFGGTYYRPIKSSVTGKKYNEEWKEFPCDWFEGLSISRQVASSIYHADVNTYGVKCGGSLDMWESSGWITKQDPYGWFQWYCRFYLGRRTDDDNRQISRWLKCAGDKGRWRNNLITKIVRSGCSYDNLEVSPVVRQTLQHWGYKLNKEDYQKRAKKLK